jgi:hypothetical protein
MKDERKRINDEDQNTKWREALTNDNNQKQNHRHIPYIHNKIDNQNFLQNSICLYLEKLSVIDYRKTTYLKTNN